jgi:guanidinopropionase
MSSLMRTTHHVSRINPGELCRLGDMGDAPINPFDIATSMKFIEDFYTPVVAASVAPLSVGGDHLITLPIMWALAKDGPVGMVHFDAHCDTGDFFMGADYHHGVPFRRAVEEGLLDPKRTIQIGIRDSFTDPSISDFSHDMGMRVV